MATGISNQLKPGPQASFSSEKLLPEDQPTDQSVKKVWKDHQTALQSNMDEEEFRLSKETLLRGGYHGDLYHDNGKSCPCCVLV